MRTVWAALIALGASTAGYMVWVVLGVCLIAYLSIHPPRRRWKRTPAAFVARYEDVSFPSRNQDVSLSGWFLPIREDLACRASGVVVLCHGMLANRAELLTWAEVLWKRGFGVLMFDFRAVGKSGGDCCSVGYYEAQDLLGAVDYLATRPDVADLSVGVFGFSMGGAAAIIAAADEQRIQAVATHGAFATLDRAIVQRCRKHFGPLASPAAWGTRALGKRWSAVPTSLIAPINAVSRLTPRPLLILHGHRDRVVHPTDARDLHAAAGHPKSIHFLPRSGHRRIHRTIHAQTQAYVCEFFESNLQPTGNTTPLEPCRL